MEETSIKHFPKSFGQNFRNLFSLENSKYFIATAAATGLSYTMDQETQEYFEAKHRWGSTGSIGQWAGGSYVMFGGTAALFAIGQFSDNYKFRRMTFDLAQAQVLSGLVTTALKATVQRTRPDMSNHASFPSGHSSSSFTMATVLEHYYGWKVGIPAYFAAAFIGASRIDKDVHHLSDVVAGAGIGYLVGRTVTRGSDLSNGPKMFFAPATSPSGHGMGLTMVIHF